MSRDAPCPGGKGGCGYDRPLDTVLARAEHKAYHLRWEHRMRAARGELPLDAADWYKYAIALERLDRARVDERHTALEPLNRQIVTLELKVAEYVDEVRDLEAHIESLEAELAAVTEGRH